MNSIQEARVSSIVSGLTDEQKEAATHFDGPLQVIAGPGSGKTETMARRAAVLIDVYEVDPSSIIMTTFTEKAAENLKNRVKKYVSNKVSVESITMGTIHSVCLNLLEDFGIEHGKFSRSIRVLDESQQSLFVWSNFKNIGLNEYFKKPNSDSISDIIKIYSQLMEKGTDIAKLNEEIDSSDEKNYKLYVALQTYEKYLELLDSEQVLDFSSILRKTISLIEDDKILEKVRAKYRFLMIDEYQDTNPIQDEILRKISYPSNNLMVIGDDDQSLYRFRGATTTNFLDFAKNMINTKVVYLSENRRSTPEIVEASSIMVSQIPAGGRAEKKLFTNNKSYQSASLVCFEDDEDEVGAIAYTIVELKKNGVIKSYSEVSILSYSVSSIFPKLKLALDAFGIPYSVKGDKSFIGQEAVQAVINGMWFFVRKRGDVKDFNLLKEPLIKFISPNTSVEIAELKLEVDVIDIEDFGSLGITSKFDLSRIKKLVELRKEILSSNYRRGYTDLVDLFFQLLTSCETIKYLTLDQSPESEIYLDHIGRFSNFILNYSDETGSRSFSDFKSYVYAILNRNIDSSDESNENSVVIQTIHQSKGLEYPVVFMPGLVESRLPGNRKDDDLIPFFNDFHKYWKIKNKNENRDSDFIRVLYVGMTRAEKLLYLSYFKKIKKAAKPSPYILPLIGSEKLEKEGFIVKREGGLSSKVRDESKLRISSSHLQYYIFCPTRYKYALKHGIQVPHRGYFAFGSNLHSAIEEVSNILRRSGPETLGKDDAKALIERHWNNYGFLNRGAAESQKQIAVERFVNFVDSHKESLSNIKYSEKKFTLEEDNFILTGKIDAISASKGDDNLVVVDFKTGEKKKFQQEPESSFVKYQGNIYVEAVERTLGVSPKNFYLHFLGENQGDEKDYKWELEVNDKSRAEVMNLLNDTAENIKMERFEPNSEPDRCKSCEFKNVCPFSSKKSMAS